MLWTPLPLAGAFSITPVVRKDPRGSFFESFRKSEFAEHGIRHDFVQDNTSVSDKGVLRGLHFQKSPKAQAKLIAVNSGSIYDVIVDIRKESPTYLKWHAETLSAAEPKLLYVPEGFAHGFLALENGSCVTYKVSEYYSPEHESGLLWNDSKLGIRWPKLDKDCRLSDKDLKFSPLR